MDWTRILTIVFLSQILTAAVRLATPLVLAALGEVFAERSGVLNLGVEGIMLLGGFAGFSAAVATENLWLGVLAGLLTGAVMGLFFAIMTVSLRSDQIVTGLAFLILSTGVAIYFYRLQFSVSLLAPSIRPFRPFAIPLLSDIPILGPVLFNQNVLTYIMLLLVPLSAIVLFRTPFGLRVTAAGEYPQAADSVGVNVTLLRYICVTVGGVLAGLGGAYFSLAELGFFANTMVGGRGFIALALVVFGRWNPLWILGGGLVFGVVDAIQTRFQFLGSTIPSNFFIMMPYLLTIIVLLIGRRQNAPAALTVPFARE